MGTKKIKLPFTIKPDRSNYIFLALFFGTISIVIAFSSLWNGGLEELEINYAPILFFPAIGLITVGYVSVFKIVLYPDRITYRISWIQGTKTMLFKDIAHIERGTRMTPVSPIPLLRIQDKNQKFFDIPVASFRENDIRRIVEIVSNANSGALLNEWAEETKEGVFKSYYHYTKIWKQILIYGFGFAIVMGIFKALYELWLK